MILGIDTSLGTAVGIADASGTVLAETASDDPRGHAEVIGTLIEQALADAGIDASQITHVAAGMGPGPFTGLRVGIAAARAFALGGAHGRGIPVIPIASHDVAAMDEVDAGGTARFAIVTDARRREEAVTVFDIGDAEPARRAPTYLQPRGGDVPARRVEVTRISGGTLARIAAARIARGTPDPDGFGEGAEPLYLRAPDVTVPQPRRTPASTPTATPEGAV